MFNYDFLKPPPVNVETLNHELENAGLPPIKEFSFNEGQVPTNLHLTFESELSSGEVAALEQIITAHLGQTWWVVARESAYRDEADPLYIAAQGQAADSGEPLDLTAWIAKRAEIKARYPKP